MTTIYLYQKRFTIYSKTFPTPQKCRCFDNACELIGNFIDCYYEWLHCHSTQWISERSLAKSQSTSWVEIDYVRPCVCVCVPFVIAENKLVRNVRPLPPLLLPIYLVRMDVKVKELFDVRFLLKNIKRPLVYALPWRHYSRYSHAHFHHTPSLLLFFIWFEFFIKMYASCMMCFYFVSFRFVC